MADLKIQADFKPLAAALKMPHVKTAGGAEGGKGFGQVMQETMNEVNKLQGDADRSIEDLATGKNKNIHETMIAISKADLAFRMTMQVRNKVMDAYQEVMRMSV